MIMSSYLIQASTHQTTRDKKRLAKIHQRSGSSAHSPAGQRVPLVGRLPLYGELQRATNGDSGLARLRRFLTCSTPAPRVSAKERTPREYDIVAANAPWSDSMAVKATRIHSKVLQGDVRPHMTLSGADAELLQRFLRIAQSPFQRPAHRCRTWHETACAHGRCGYGAARHRLALKLEGMLARSLPHHSGYLRNS